MSLSSIFDHQYRALVALNALAIKLMRQGKFPEAGETLSDAINVAKSALHTNSPASCTRQAIDHANESVKKAVQRSLAKGSIPRPEEAPIAVNVLTYSITNSFVTEVPPTPQAKEVYLIRMDADCASNSVEDSLNLESCIILMNMGVAHLLISSTQESNPESSELYENRARAVHIFQLARTLIHQLIEDFDDSENPDSEMLCGLLQMETIIYHGLIPVLRILGGEAVAECCARRKEDLALLVQELVEERIHCILGGEPASAA